MKIITWNCQGIGGDLTVDNLVDSRYVYLKKRLGMDFLHAVEPKGMGGGLCVFWKDASSVRLVKSVDHMIEVKVWDEEKECHWRLFGIYASTDEKKRRDQWRTLGNRIGRERDLCLLIGDFNDILCNGEKEGGNHRSAASMRDFREFVATNELLDLGYEGYPFTWRNKRDSLPIQQRLDRGFASLGWHDLYPDTKILHVALEDSDHSLLLLTTKKSEEWRGRRFMYDARWSNSDECRNLVARDWAGNVRGSHAFRLSEKLKAVSRSLKRWYRENGRNTKKTIDMLKGELRKVYQSAHFASEESSNPTYCGAITSSVQSRVSHDDNLMLTARVTEVEIQEAAFQIPPTRAPGPDGFSGSFYQDHWEVVGADVISTVKAFWQSGKILKKLNHTNLVLIPKVACPKNMTQYRPIALCNVIYKVLAKILHSLMHQSKEDRAGMALKLDMAKAYDRVEWGFLLIMMAKLGFDPIFCSWIKECVSSASYSILMNGTPKGYILPQRGLRQGDPLSPYLFLLLRVTPNGMPITHLLFADDSVLFCEATVEEARGVRNILNSYAVCSGQEINMLKSSIFYSSKSNAGFGKYLGLQADFGHSKKVVVATAMPNHAMSCFKLPIGVCRDIEKAIRSYWWRGGGASRGVHWTSWDRLLQKKNLGGLGFKDFQARKVLDKGLIWRVGDGKSIKIREDPWYPMPSTFCIRPAVNLDALYVRDLINQDSMSWNEDLISACFSSEEANTILSIPISKSGACDRLGWFHTANGVYSVKSGYGIAMELMENGGLGKKGRGASSDKTKYNKTWNAIWSLDVPRKMRFFIWKCCNHALAVRKNLKRRHMRVDNICGVCGLVDETENHIFFRCETSHLFWFCSPLQINSFDLEGADFLQSWVNFYNRVAKLADKDELLQEFVFGLWRLWKNRNEAIFRGSSLPPTEILDAWNRNVVEYRNATKRVDQGSPIPAYNRDAGVERRKVCWKKPCFGMIKVNTDAAWCKASQRAGLGWVARDFAGVLHGAGGTGASRFHSAAAAEATAIRGALEFCLLQGFDNVIVESDAEAIVLMIRKELIHDFRIGCVLGDIENLARKMHAVSFVFAPRESNTATHLVAKFVFKEGREFVWDCIGPEFLFNTLAIDANLFLRL
ncbi:unnamed protein product [Malus baccata var. baccata]